MTPEPTPRTGLGRVLYESILGIAAGFSLGWFAWFIADRAIDTDLRFWPWAAAGILFGVIGVRQVSSRRQGRRWVHLLWIPVAAFVILMTMVVLALRAWGS